MKKLCEYITLEKKNLARLYLTGSTWVIYCGIMPYMFTWVQTSVKFALGVYWAILFSISCVLLSSLPHNLNLPSGVCESFTIIILDHVWYLFLFSFFFSLPQAVFPLCFWPWRRVVEFQIEKIFIASPRANIFQTIWPGNFAADHPFNYTHMHCGGCPGSGNSCRSSLAVMRVVLFGICGVWEDACVVIPVLFDRFGSFTHYWGNDKWDQPGPSGPSAFIFSARTQCSLKATMDEISI